MSCTIGMYASAVIKNMYVEKVEKNRYVGFSYLAQTSRNKIMWPKEVDIIIPVSIHMHMEGVHLPNKVRFAGKKRETSCLLALVLAFLSMKIVTIMVKS